MNSCLISIGCSFIEGAGAAEHNVHLYYDEEKVKLGIAHNMQKKLNYDTLINIGIGSSGISRQLEYFLSNVDIEQIKSDYEKVTLFLFVTYPTRWNKYINGKSEVISIDEMNLIPKIKNNQNPKNSYEDAIREQAIYVNVFDSLCKSNNFKFIWACVDDVQEKIYKESNIVNSTKDLMPSQFENHPWIPFFILNKYNLMAKDSHPNKDGYELISNKMVEWIIKNRPELKNNFEVDNHKIYSILDLKLSEVNLHRINTR